MLISVVLTLIVIGVLLGLVNTYIPMPAWMRQVINITVAIIVIVWLLRIFGLLDGMNALRFP